jgi:hypothetical protein
MRTRWSPSGLKLRSPLPPTLQEGGSIQGLWGEEGCPEDRDGTPPRCDGGAEHPFAGCSAQDRDPPHSAVDHTRHHSRLYEDGRWSSQQPLHV